MLSLAKEVRVRKINLILVMSCLTTSTWMQSWKIIWKYPNIFVINELILFIDDLNLEIISGDGIMKSSIRMNHSKFDNSKRKKVKNELVHWSPCHFDLSPAKREHTPVGASNEWSRVEWVESVIQSVLPTFLRYSPNVLFFSTPLRPLDTKSASDLLYVQKNVKHSIIFIICLSPL